MANLVTSSLKFRVGKAFESHGRVFSRCTFSVAPAELSHSTSDTCKLFLSVVMNMPNEEGRQSLSGVNGAGAALTLTSDMSQAQEVAVAVPMADPGSVGPPVLGGEPGASSIQYTVQSKPASVNFVQIDNLIETGGGGTATSSGTPMSPPMSPHDSSVDSPGNQKHKTFWTEDPRDIDLSAHSRKPGDRVFIIGGDLEQLKEIIKKQVEYYFSEKNLKRDKFFRSRMRPDGWISIGVLTSFERIKALTSNIDLIVEALLASPSLEVDTEGTIVRLKEGWEKWILPESSTPPPSTPSFPNSFPGNAMPIPGPPPHAQVPIVYDSGVYHGPHSAPSGQPPHHYIGGGTYGIQAIPMMAQPMHTPPMYQPPPGALTPPSSPGGPYAPHSPYQGYGQFQALERGMMPPSPHSYGQPQGHLSPSMRPQNSEWSVQGGRGRSKHQSAGSTKTHPGGRVDGEKYGKGGHYGKELFTSRNKGSKKGEDVKELHQNFAETSAGLDDGRAHKKTKRSRRRRGHHQKHDAVSVDTESDAGSCISAGPQSISRSESSISNPLPLGEGGQGAGGRLRGMSGGSEGDGEFEDILRAAMRNSAAPDLELEGVSVQTCQRKKSCSHPCQLPADHSGECPLCLRMVSLTCFCGVRALRLRCYESQPSSKAYLKVMSCGYKCAKQLPNCSHKCVAICHPGPCPSPEKCRKQVYVRCPCKRIKIEKVCEEVQEAKRQGKALVVCDAICARASAAQLKSESDGALTSDGGIDDDSFLTPREIFSPRRSQSPDNENRRRMSSKDKGRITKRKSVEDRQAGIKDKAEISKAVTSSKNRRVQRKKWKYAYISVIILAIAWLYMW